MTEPTTDLRVAARALLADAGPLAMRHEALQRIVEIARAATPVMVGEADLDVLAVNGDGEGFGRSTVNSGVAIIPLKGILTPRPSLLSILFGGSSGGLLGFRSDLREALGHRDVETIVIDVNSPGGSVSLITETAAEVRAARGDKPIIAVANTMAASAAYAIAAQADEIVVTPSGFVGSIGVYIVHYDFSAMNEAIGVKPTYISAGRYKTEGHEDAPLDEVALAAIQLEVDDFYATFVQDVADGRGVTTEEVRGGYGEGRVLTAQRALTANLVDSIATLEEVVTDRISGARAPAGGGRASAGRRSIPAQTALDPHVEARIAEIHSLTPPVTRAQEATNA